MIKQIEITIKSKDGDLRLWKKVEYESHSCLKCSKERELESQCGRKKTSGDLALLIQKEGKQSKEGAKGLTNIGKSLAKTKHSRSKRKGRLIKKKKRLFGGASSRPVNGNG